MTINSGGSLDRAFEELIQRVVENTLATVRQDLARLAEVAAAQSVAPEPAAAEPAPAPAPSVTGGGSLRALSQSLAGVLQPTAQTEIMAATLKAAAAVAGRAALFVRRGDNFSVWRAEGFSAADSSALRSVSASAAQAGAFKDVCDRQNSVCLSRAAADWPAGLDSALSQNSPSSPAAEICLLPVAVAGKVVAALIAEGGAGSDTMGGLEIVARVTGLSLETAGTRGAASAAGGAAGAETKPEAAISQPVPPAAAPVAEAPAPPPAEPPPRGSFAASSPPVAAAAHSETSAAAPPPDVESLPEAERDSHKKAHRFARVAVQDLLSYHKNKIAEGRNNRNLYTVLREDIEKTRENYQKKFGQTAAGSFDYLHYEMIAKLAGNDPAVLGDQYPGPVGG